MRRATWMRLLMVLAAVGLMSGCVVVHDEPRGELTLFWDCAGYNCADVGVSSIIVEISQGSHMVAGPQQFGGDASGANFADLEPGIYDYHVVGTGPTGMVLYEVFSSADVHGGGDNQYDVHLAQVY